MKQMHGLRPYDLGFIAAAWRIVKIESCDVVCGTTEANHFVN